MSASPCMHQDGLEMGSTEQGQIELVGDGAPSERSYERANAARWCRRCGALGVWLRNEDGRDVWEWRAPEVSR